MKTEITDFQGRFYVVADGTYYDYGTPDDVVRVLEEARKSRRRVRLFQGDRETGVAWPEEYNVTGTIGRSTGSIKSPLLIHNSRSMGGGAILTACVLGVMETSTKIWLYRHPKLDLGKWSISSVDHPVSGELLLWRVEKNGELYARTTTRTEAQRLVDFMTGKRASK